MLSRDEMPDDNAKLAKIKVAFPHVPLKGIAAPTSFLKRISKYLEIESYEPDGELKFLRTDKVEKKLYYIWSFESRSDPCFVTVAIGPGREECIGCNENHWGLTPEQFILADYHECI